MKLGRLIPTLCLAVSLLLLSASDLRSAGRRIVISVPQKQLQLIEGHAVLKTYAIAVGTAATPSPLGRWQIVNRIDHPTWYAHGRPVTPGPRNPLGTRWIGLSKSGYGIHGTNEPASIGQAASHGCIRMRNQDVEELFALVEPGMTVELIDF